ncbi:hypothetical protein OGATHE_004529 [Ogataea polymorpha]|uniref:Uncharacterized protein n=1 Tax=Ogataea polymorpha TaxID=460523 RepID=A0A9P8NZU1_9ASCO|nr:hypothetical protein OGATHE_004529 [Ogataea polymorpha]
MCSFGQVERIEAIRNARPWFSLNKKFMSPLPSLKDAKRVDNDSFRILKESSGLIEISLVIESTATTLILKFLCLQSSNNVLHSCDANES